MPRKINPNSLKNLEKRKPFVKGDPRIMPGRKAKSFDELRALMQDMANETIDDKTMRTRLENIILAMSSDKRLMKEFLEFAYGKVPMDTNVNLRGEISWKQFIESNKPLEENKDD